MATPRPIDIKSIALLSVFVLSQAVTLIAETAPQIPHDDALRIAEFYRLAAQIQDSLWAGWSEVLAPLMLITSKTEFLTHWAKPPAEFRPAGNGFYQRPRQFPPTFLATFPPFGPPAIIVIGEPANTEAKTSTLWLLTVMHEHFHQFQYAQPGYYEAVKGLGLNHGDETGMWMLNYPFPYNKPEVGESFAPLRDLLLAAVTESDAKKFATVAQQYVQARKKFFAQLSPDDAKYLNFQLWQESIALYMQIKAAEAAGAEYHPTEAYVALPDYESFSSYGAKARQQTLDELKHADLAKWQRVVVYSFGATEGLLLDRMNTGWKSSYFQHFFTLEPYFEAAQ